MKQFDTQFKQLDVFPMVKYFMDQLDLFSLFNKYVPAAADRSPHSGFNNSR